MLLVATLVVMTSQGGLLSAGNEGGLHEPRPSRVHLLAEGERTGTLLADASGPRANLSPNASSQWQRLEDERQSLVGPTVTTIIGAVVTGLGLVGALLGLVVAVLGNPLLLWISLPVTLIGVGVLAAGISLVKAANDLNDDIDSDQRQLVLSSPSAPRLVASVSPTLVRF